MKIKELLKKSPVYLATYNTMIQLQMAYLGGDTFKKFTRRKRPSEDAAIYADCIQHTVALPLCRYIVDTVNDVVFEPGVRRNMRFATPEGREIRAELSDWSDLLLVDATLDNRSLDNFMEDVGDLSSIFGWCWVFVDMPPAETGNLGRPYVTAISPLMVWNWEWECVRGVYIPEEVTVCTQEDEECYYVTRYCLGEENEPTRYECYEIEKKDNMEQELEPYRVGYYPPGMAIPGFIAYGRRDPRTRDIGISDIDSASDAMRELYKLETEAYQSLQFARTIIRADAGVRVPAHAGAIVRASEGQIEAINVDTQDVNNIIAKQQDILEGLEQLTGFSGLRQNRTQSQSGISIVEERRSLHRLAKAKARLMEIAEEQIFTFAARFMDQRWAGEVEYNTDYEKHDTRYRLALMREAQALVPGNPIIQGLVAQEIVAMLAPEQSVADYQEAMMATQDPTFQAINTQTQQAVSTRDTGSQLPTPEEELYDVESEPEYPQDETLGPGTGIRYTGLSSYNPVADQLTLVGTAQGR